MTNPAFESQHSKFAKLMAANEGHLLQIAVRRNKSSENQIQTGLMSGTPITFPSLRSGSTQSSSIRLPKLSADQKPSHVLHKRRLKTGLTPCIGYKAVGILMSGEDYEAGLAATATGSISSSSNSAISKDPTLDFLHKLNLKIQRLHQPSLPSPITTPRDDQRTIDTLQRCSFELETVQEISVTEKDEGVIEGIVAKKAKIEAKHVRASMEEGGGMAGRTVGREWREEREWKVKKRKVKAGTGINLSIDQKPTPDQLSAINALLYCELNLIVLRTLGIPSYSPENTYRFFLGPGNNSQLIAFLMKRRWFWSRVDNWQQADFIWTQHRTNSIIESLEMTPIFPIRSSQYEDRADPLPALSGKKKAFQGFLDSERTKAGLSLINTSESYNPMEGIPSENPLKVYNRIDRNYQLTSKKRLFINLQSYYDSLGIDVFATIPLTFLIKTGPNDSEFHRFSGYFHTIEAEIAAKPDKSKQYNIWIIKPGENTNCGHGIHVSSDISEIESLISNTTTASGRKRTFIVQKYIEKPLLVNKRKFDIRCYGLLTCFNGHVQGYFYHDGYLRTSSKEFTLKNTSNRFIHLTNDAVQKKSDDYGKYENGNKMSYPEFHRYLEANYPGQVDFWSDIWPQIRRIMTDSYRATYRQVDPLRRNHMFEVLGYDFMIDEKFKVWLIEVNTNPCLALSSAYLAKLIPQMLDNAFRIVLDPVFPEPTSAKKKTAEWSTQGFENRFELVFSSLSSLPPSPSPALGISVASDESESSEGEEAN